MDIESKDKVSPNLSSLSSPFNLSQPCQDTPNLSQNPQQPLYQPQLVFTNKVKASVQTNKNNYTFLGQLQIRDNQYTFRYLYDQADGAAPACQDQDQDWVYLNVEYRDTQTVGTSGDFLVVFVDSEKNFGNQGQDQGQGQEDANAADEVLELISTQKQGNFFLRGQSTLTLQFSTKQQMQKAYELLSLYVGEQDEGNSEYGQDEEMEEMISADNIDENGNVIFQNQEQSDQQEEGEDGEMEDENQNEKQGGI